MDFIVNWIGKFIVFSFFIFLSYYFSKPSAEKSIGNEKMVCHSWFMKVVGVIVVIFGLGIYFYEVNFNGVKESELSEVIPLLVITIAIIVLGFIIVLETFRSRVFISEDGIRKESVWTRDHLVKWDHIESLSHSKTFSMVTIKALNGSKIRVIDYMNGFDELMSEIDERKPLSP